MNIRAKSADNVASLAREHARKALRSIMMLEKVPDDALDKMYAKELDALIDLFWSFYASADVRIHSHTQNERP